MKIGFFTDGFFPQVNGVSIAVDTLAKELRKKGHQVYIISPWYPGYKSDKDEIRIRSILVQRKYNIRIATYIPTPSLYKALRIDFDIIHGHNGGPLSHIGLEYARLRKIPYVFSHHTLWEAYTHYFYGLATPRVIKFLTRYLSNRSGFQTVPSEKIKHTIISYGVKKPISIIPNGIDLTKFSKTKSDYLRQHLKISKNKKILIFVGRLGKEKSVDFIIESFSKIYKKNSNCVLVIVGDGPLKKDLMQLSNKLKVQNSVIFAGFMDPVIMPKVYSSADLFLFASNTETQGMALVEAMASALPIVAVEDEVVRAITYGHAVYSQKNETEFAKLALNLLSNKKDYIKQVDLGLKTAKKYSIKKITDKIEKIYLSICMAKKLRIVGISGPIASGKGVIAKLLEKKGFKKLELSQIINSEILKQRLKLNRNTQQNVGNKLRAKFGNNYLAKKTIENALSGRYKKIVIDGIRNPAEIKFLIDKYNAIVIGVSTPVDLRKKWFLKRSKGSDKQALKNFEKVEKRDRGIGENASGQQVTKCLKLCDVIIKNNTDDPKKEEFKKAVAQALDDLGI
ncbi:glycosyltransferase [Patescibacteria group bacterium]|nr:glycosyltransferase [Patescibacteria group bacterium]